jgi:hypothetical protein
MHPPPPPPPPPTNAPDASRSAIDPARAARALRRSEWLAKFLDNAIAIPGTSHRVGFDAVIGLVPGVGDLITTALGGIIIVEAVRVKAPGSMVAKMVGNVLLDGLMGAVPGLGDVVDIFFRSNTRNLALLREHLKGVVMVEGVAPVPETRAETPRRHVENMASQLSVA